MKRTLRSSLSVVLSIALLAAIAIRGSSQEVKAPGGAPSRSTDGALAPEAWAFPSERVVPTFGAGGMVASTDRVASEIGVEILRRGGNAVDAAVAVHFALAVVNPEAGNIGGGGFMIVSMTGQGAYALDFREKAPLAATRDMFLADGGRPTDRSRVGLLAAGVPGSVAGMWEAHRRFGATPWADLLAPAIHLAEGIVVHERLASSLQQYERSLGRYPATAAIFLPNGSAPRVGDRFVQHDLAETLKRIASQGKDGFYRGETAKRIAAEMQRGGGVISEEDLLRYEAVWREPIRFQYRDSTVLSMPPPSSGGVALAEILNILEGFDLARLGFHSPAHVHLFAEASKRAFADRNAYLADPDFVSQPTATLTSDAYAAVRRTAIDAHRATPSDEVRPGLPATVESAPTREGDDTTHYSIVDGRGDAVSVTTTINSLYGSLATVSGAGFLLNNEMDDFTTSPGAPNQFGLVQGEQNAVEPQKRMLSSMSPTIVLDSEGKVKLVTGSPGGPTIISTVAQMISNVVDFHMDLGQATAAPRLHHQHVPDLLYYERDGLARDVIDVLREMGHTIETRSEFQGDTQSILVLPGGALAGLADPRRGGAALGVRPLGDVVP